MTLKIFRHFSYTNGECYKLPWGFQSICIIVRNTFQIQKLQKLIPSSDWSISLISSFFTVILASALIGDRMILEKFWSCISCIQKPCTIRVKLFQNIPKYFVPTLNVLLLLQNTLHCTLQDPMTEQNIPNIILSE